MSKAIPRLKPKIFIHCKRQEANNEAKSIQTAQFSLTITERLEKYMPANHVLVNNKMAQIIQAKPLNQFEFSDNRDILNSGYSRCSGFKKKINQNPETMKTRRN